MSTFTPRLALLGILGALGWSTPAAAQQGPADVPRDDAPARSALTEAPTVAYAYTAHGASAGTMGAQTYGLGLAGRGDGRGAIVGGGVTVWGAPIDRLTLVGDASRDAFGEFAPSAAAIVRVLGRPGDGFSLGVLGKFKVDGFAVGPNKEMESEIESGLLLSYARSGWHGDLNAIGGVGTGDDGEVDAEARLRLGKDLGDIARIGVDGQMRYRVHGDNALVGGRTWDFAGGPQVMVVRGPFFAALTGGPATMGVYHGVGLTGVVTLGGSAF
jgi:hypothetical protein